MVYARPNACCKADDKIEYTDPVDGKTKTGCPPEWREFIQAFEPKFTGEMADKVMGCSDGKKIDKETKRCPPGYGQGFDTPTGIQAFAELKAAFF